MDSCTFHHFEFLIWLWSFPSSGGGTSKLALGSASTDTLVSAMSARAGNPAITLARILTHWIFMTFSELNVPSIELGPKIWEKNDAYLSTD